MNMNSYSTKTIVLLWCVGVVLSAPLPLYLPNDQLLAYLAYLQQNSGGGIGGAAGIPGLVNLGWQPDQDISRSANTADRTTSTANNYDSPIYYVRLPPLSQQYLFMAPPPPPPQTQLGYLESQVGSVASHSATQPFVNLQLDFLANGKPSTVYRWHGGGAATLPLPSQSPPPTKSPSTIHRLTGPQQYLFNGKPDDIFLLRDTYNTFYSDALQNIYP